MTFSRQLAIVGAAALALAGSARDAGAQDATAGARIAERWCAACHATSARGSDAAPSFETIAGSPKGEPARLRSFLAEPHPPMPPLQLTHQEIEDLVAFVASRKSR